MLQLTSNIPAISVPVDLSDREYRRFGFSELGEAIA